MNLQEIVGNILTIQMQDSLIAVGNMTEEERMALATSMKKKKDEDRINAAKQKAAAQQGNAQSPNLPKGAPAPAGYRCHKANGQWLFRRKKPHCGLWSSGRGAFQSKEYG